MCSIKKVVNKFNDLCERVRDVRTSGILGRIPSGVKRKICNYHTRFKPMDRTAREGMNNVLGHKGVPLPQRLCPQRAWTLWGPISMGALRECRGESPEPGPGRT